MAIYLIIILGIFIVTFLSFRIGDIFSPWFITTGIWLTIIITFQITHTELYPLQSRFYNCVLIWAPCMCITGIMTYYAFPAVNNSQQAVQEDFNYSQFFFLFFYILSMVCTPLYL